MVNISDVAKKAGVSKSSVSRVLNQNYNYMSETTKQKVLTAIKELNYTPNSVAQSLKTKKSQVVGVVLSDLSNPFWSEVLKGVQFECRNRGYGLMVSSSEEDASIEKENVSMLINKQVDGFIINTTGQNETTFKQLKKEEFPFVFLDRISKEVNQDTVIVNNISGAKNAVQYLIDQGHKEIAILLYTIGNRSTRSDRLQGYKEALKDNNIDVNNSHIKICKEIKGSGGDAIQELLESENRPTAIFSTHSLLNLEALSAIKKTGFKVPDDISLFGYDDFPWVPLLDPPLTTVVQPAFQLGVEACASLIAKINNEKVDKERLILLEPELAIRESCVSPK